MSSTSRAWIAAASIGTVEALKYQGICRWNQALRSLHQRAKKGNLRPCPQANKQKSPAMSNAVTGKIGKEKVKKPAQEPLRKVMYLSSWGPY
ncbi:hypothetical protein CDL15_Pgr002456 [Punica granatum]|uniref:Wound-responsive family protein n=1 Tax=Punica granatum TaxID=22663 RepID=A0A218XVR3_PUNGR|nr:hypothetical protein CDL15_Pgr002456 [Punica granatum]